MITRVPYNLGENLALPHLKVLNLAFNSIEQIEGSIFSNLIALECLDLRFNKLNYLPKEMASLKNLKHLYLTGNLMVELPCFIKDIGLVELQHEWVALCKLDLSAKIFSGIF